MHHTDQPQMSHMPKPMSGTKHFWLSFLAVVTGVPVAALIVSAGFFIMMFFFVLLIAVSAPQSGSGNPKLVMSTVYGEESARDTLAIVPVRGPILSGSATSPLQSLFGGGYADGELIKEQLRILADDNIVKGVMLDIDSPGGMITASKAIADGVEYYRSTTKKPIIAYINGTGASGAYWSAVSTDAIYAQQGSEVGSIGVIFGPLVTYKNIVNDGSVTTTDPINYRYFSAGRSKDLGSPFRDITPDEEAFLNAQIQDEYVKFVSYVSERRSIPADTIKNDIGALAYGTTTALSKKLMDKEMSKEDAYTELATRASVTDYRMQRIDGDGSFLGSIFGAQGLLRGRMSASERAAGRAQFCATNLVGKPLVMSGDLMNVCK